MVTRSRCTSAATSRSRSSYARRPRAPRGQPASVHSRTQILDADIDLGRRQAFLFAEGISVAVESGAWNTLQPLVETVQASVDAADAELTDHFGGAGRRHPATAIDFAPHAFLTAVTVQAALVELLDKLLTAAAGNPGAKRVGADAVRGTPHALGPGTVDAQLSQLLAWLNAHVGAASGAHNASAIAALPHNNLSATNIQAQLQEILDNLASRSSTRGAALVGNAAMSGSPHSLSSNSVRSHVGSLLSPLCQGICRLSSAASRDIPLAFHSATNSADSAASSPCSCKGSTRARKNPRRGGP